MLAGVLPSGQQPNSLLSQDDRSSPAAKVGVDNVGPRGGEGRKGEGRQHTGDQSEAGSFGESINSGAVEWSRIGLR